MVGEELERLGDATSGQGGAGIHTPPFNSSSISFVTNFRLKAIQNQARESWVLQIKAGALGLCPRDS